MTGKEFFNLYKGGTVKVSASGIRKRICGYYDDGGVWVVLDQDSGSTLTTFGPGSKYVMLPNLPPDWRGNTWRLEQLDMDSVEYPEHEGRLCCRCGNMYRRKKEHRLTCGRKQ